MNVRYLFIAVVNKRWNVRKCFDYERSKEYKSVGGSRSGDRSAFGNLAGLLEIFEFFFGFGKLGLESGIGMETGHGYGTGDTACVNVALEMIAADDTA